ncbi:glycosyltransferase family 4 protein [Flavobacterium sp. LB1P71]|uniref:glycosyltransferase family 4 protein n=1 Tax=unclassified Flavobacterium TaxID=196869 RepID=UPI003AAF6F85
MKILVLSNCPIVESQGSGYVIINTAKCLESQGHIIRLIPPEGISILNFLGSRAKIYRMIFGMAIWSIFNNLKKYELIIFYGAECFLAVFIIKNIFRIKTPIVLHSNGIEVLVGNNLTANSIVGQIEKKWYHFDLSTFFKYCYKSVNAIITVSKSESEFLINELKINPNRVHFNNLGLPDIYFKNNLKIEKSKIITYCGTWIMRKGVDVLKTAIPVILSKYPDYRFRIIGVGNDFILENHFRAEIINQIEVIPFVGNKDKLMVLYMESSIFLFPSLSESFGLVIAEAMYCGSALITGPTGFAAELKTMENAIVLNEINKKNIIDAIELLIQDDKFREKISQNGMLKASELTWINYNLKLKTIIESVN